MPTDLGTIRFDRIASLPRITPATPSETTILSGPARMSGGTIVLEPPIGAKTWFVTAIDSMGKRIRISSGDRAALSIELEEAFTGGSSSTIGLSSELSTLSPAQATLAASVVLAGLGWMIARRNAVPEGERGSSSEWAAAVGRWLMDLVMGLVGREQKEMTDA